MKASNLDLKNLDYLSYTNPNQCIKVCDSILKTTLNNDSNNLEYLQLIARSNMILKNYTIGKEGFERVLVEAKAFDSDKYQTIAFIGLGNYYNHKGFYGIAIDNYLEALKFAKKIKSKRRIAVLYNNIAVVYDGQKKYKEAISYFKKAIVKNKELNNERLEALANANLSRAYHTLKIADSSIHYNKLVGAYLEKHKDIDLLVDYYEIKYHIGELTKNTDSLRYYLDKANEIISTHNLESKKSYLTYLEACYYHEIGDLNKSLQFGLSALEKESTNNKLQTLSNIYKLISTVYEEKQEFKNSNIYLKKYKVLIDSMKTLEQIRFAEEQKVKFKLLEKEELIKKGGEEIAKLKAKDDKNAVLQSILILLLVSALTISLYLYLKHRKDIKERRTKEQLLKTAYQLLREKEEKMQLELENQSNELSKNSMEISKKNKILEELKTEMSDIIQSLNSREDALKMEKLMKQFFNTEKNWDVLKRTIDLVDHQFAAKIRADFPSLTDTDLRICTLIRFNLSSKEIANLLNIEQKSVNMSRYRLRKKLALKKEQDLSQFIASI